MSREVAVAVISWNTRDLLDACLASLRPEVEAGRAAVWVVDNASTDGSAAMVAERHQWAQLIALDDNIGFGRAVNLVAAQAPDAAFIAPANADIELEPGALEALLQAAEADPHAGALAPRLLLPDGGTQHSVYPFPTLPFTVAFNLGLQRVSARLADAWCLEGAWDPERPRRVPWAIAAFLLVRRPAWDAVGGFDERQWMYAEDLDIGWRLHKAGLPTRYVPESRVPQWQAATYAWRLRRRGPVITRAVAAVNVLGAGTRWAVRAPLARVRPARWAPARDSYRAWARVHRSGLASRAELERRS